MRKKRLPIGISDFKVLIDEGYAYVDKTMLIQELVDKGGAVALFPRMRRFGKTLNLSMLRYFFEKTSEDTSHLFSPLQIWKEKSCRELQGKFPVIFLTLKDIKHSTWEDTYDSFQKIMAEEFESHRYLLDGNLLSEGEKSDFLATLSKNAKKISLEQSLRDLTKWLMRYHQRRVIILIDEYDAPALAAYVHGYYDILIPFLRNWLSAGLKDNTSLERGVLTGILRIAKESIFSGLNNIQTFSILHTSFQDKFGLLENEVKALLEEYGLVDKMPSIKKWYNGYRIGSCDGIYNPWSVLQCLSDGGSLIPYWVNTSDNALMKQLITQGTDTFKTDVEELMKGHSIEKKIEEGLILTDLNRNTDAVWSLLLFSGYLTLGAAPPSSRLCHLRIPNTEVKELYTSMILEWFKTSIDASRYQLMLSSLVTGDIDTFSKIFQNFLISSVSVFDVPSDEPEKVYHAFVLGMLIGLEGRYEVRSNRESGYGRYDVMLIPKDIKELGIVIEFKKIDRFEKMTLEEAAESALKQIRDKQYDKELTSKGVCKILHLALAFEGEKVLIQALSPPI